MRLSRRAFVALASAFAAGTACTHNLAHSAHEMEPSNSAASLQDFLAARGLTSSQLSVPQLVENMLSFYRTVRASGLANDPQADMLLFEWGVFNWGKGDYFQIDLTRQFIVADQIDDDAISQLHCTAYFTPTPELRAIPTSHRWCHSVAEIEPFSAFILGSAAYRAVNSVSPQQVALHWERI
jgi:hypothetical protein